MSASLGATPTARVYEVEELVALVHAGELRIPEFQRPFRWGIEDARRLFDSILRGYPLGSLLLWERRAEQANIRVGALHIDAPALNRALWVVDGQQRVTTLANSLSFEASNDDRFALSFNLTTQQFLPGVSDQRATVVPLPVLFDLQNLMQWFRQRPEAMDYFDAATSAAKKIRQFKIPASVVETQDESVLRDIFDRLNSYGKRLTRAEVFSALHPVTDSKGRAPTSVIEEISGYLAEDLEFGDVDGDTVLRAVLARRGPDITREIRGEFDDDRRGDSEYPGEDADTAYHEAQKALERAIRFLQNNADVPHFAFLPYRHLLIVLARLFAHHPVPNARETQLLRRWFWRAAAAGPEIFPGSTTGTARALCSRVIPGDLDRTLAGLLAAVPKDRVGYPDVDHFRTNHATGKMIACSMWALGPRSLRDGTRIDRAALIEALGDAQTPRPALTAIVPRRGLPEEIADSAARWLLVPGVEAAPSEVPALLAASYDLAEQAWQLTCKSHAVVASAAERLANYDLAEFVRIRTETLRTTLKKFMDSRWEYGFEDTPPLDRYVLDDLETEDSFID